MAGGAGRHHWLGDGNHPGFRRAIPARAVTLGTVTGEVDSEVGRSSYVNRPWLTLPVAAGRCVRVVVGGLRHLSVDNVGELPLEDAHGLGFLGVAASLGVVVADAGAWVAAQLGDGHAASRRRLLTLAPRCRRVRGPVDTSPLKRSKRVSSGLPARHRSMSPSEEADAKCRSCSYSEAQRGGSGASFGARDTGGWRHGPETDRRVRRVLDRSVGVPANTVAPRGAA